MNSSASPRSAGLVAILAPLIVVAACIATYANSFAAGFVFDDIPGLFHNASIRTWPAAILNSSRPLTQATFLLSYRLHGLEPASFRLLNVLIHTLAALLLFGVIRRTAELVPSATRSKATATLISALAAALWAAHPLQTESVTYIVQRAEALAGMCLLLCLYAFVRALTARRADRWLTLSLVACTMGMASKPVMLAAPLLILLYDRTFAAGSLRQLWDKRRTYYLLLASTWLVLAAILSAPTESDRSTGLGPGLPSPAAYFCEQQTVIWHYVRLIFMPRPLCLDYGWLPESSRLQTALAGAAHGVVLLTAVWLFLRRRAAGFCLLWFYVALLPTSGFFPVADLAVEHRLYAPLAGLAGWVAALALGPAADGRCRQGLTIFTLAVLTVLASLSSRLRNEDYRSQLTMYEQVLKLRPENLRARVAFTEALLKSGDFVLAEQHIAITLAQIDRILKAAPGTFHPFRVRIAAYYVATVQDQRGRARFGQGDYAEAERCFAGALASDPDDAVIHANMAAAELLLERPDDALAAARKATALLPSYARPHAIAAQAHLARGDAHAAATSMRRALALDPDDAATRLDLAWLLATTPDTTLADAHAAIALAETVLAATGNASYRAHQTLAAAQRALDERKLPAPAP